MCQRSADWLCQFPRVIHADKLVLRHLRFASQNDVCMYVYVCMCVYVCVCFVDINSTTGSGPHSSDG